MNYDFSLISSISLQIEGPFTVDSKWGYAKGINISY
jgi:hypothetical protein